MNHNITQELTEESIIESVLASKSKEETGEMKEEEDMKEEDDDDDLPAANIPSNTAQCLDAISGIRAFFQASTTLPQNVFDALTILEDYALQSQLSRRNKQCKVTDLFTKKEK